MVLGSASTTTWARADVVDLRHLRFLRSILAKPLVGGEGPETGGRLCVLQGVTRARVGWLVVVVTIPAGCSAPRSPSAFLAGVGAGRPFE